MMEKKTWKQFHQDLRWSTRIYTLAVVLVIVFSFFFNAWSTNWAFTMIAVIASLLFVETFAYYFAHHPRAWLLIRWLLIILLLCLIVIGSIG